MPHALSREALVICRSGFERRPSAGTPSTRRGAREGGASHCEECHTPRNFLGGLKRSQAFAGNLQGPDGQKAPNITADAETGIGKWTVEDIAALLKTGQTPDFDFVGSGMAEVVKGTAALSDEDRRAIAVYVKSLPAIHSERKAKD